MTPLSNQAIVLLYADEIVTVSSAKALLLESTEFKEVPLTKRCEDKTSTIVPRHISFDIAKDDCPISPLDDASKMHNMKYSIEEVAKLQLPDNFGKIESDNSPSTETVDGNNSSSSEDEDSSVTSIVSGRSRDSSNSIVSDSPSSSKESECTKLRYKWEMRDQELKRLTRGKTANYTRYMKENEEEAKKLALMRLEMKRYPSVDEKTTSWNEYSCSTASLGVSQTSCSSIETKPFHFSSATQSMLSTLYSQLRRLFYFELYYTLPSFVTILIYCIAHISIYEFVSGLMIETTRNFTHEGETLVYSFILLTGLIVMRASGYLWEWVHDDELPLLKFDMQNRLRLRDFDAHILLWLHRHKSIRAVIYIISIYMCYASVSYFLSSLTLPYLFDIRKSILEGLPSRELEVTTYIYDKLNGIETEWPSFSQASGVSGNECLNADQITDADDEYFWSRASSISYDMLMGNEVKGIGVVSTLGYLVFYSCASVLSVSFLVYCGFDFWQL